jgi:N-acetylgalactosamine-N,N'-diacetylbacillosaminyl-diphospho-undecaprenol 4-alpha-N-acetylgalactosaminyltransferase
MKIVLLINSLKLGGAEKVLQTVANQLCDDYEIHLITIERHNFYNLNNNIKVYPLSSNDEKINKFLKILLIVKYAVQLNKYLRLNDIKIVQSHLFRSNYINIVAKLLGGNHSVQIVDHTLPNRLYQEGLSGKINLLLIKLLYKYADVSISVTNVLQHQLDDIVKLPRQKFVIHNPFNVIEIRKKASEVIDDFDFIDDNFYLIAVGRINSVKRYDLIINALNIINNQKIHLLLLGEEEDILVDDLLRKSNNKQNIHFLGKKLNPYPYIKYSNVLLLTSDSESFGNVIVESMICGTSVISSDCGGPREILAPGSNVNIQLKDSIEKAEYGVLFPIGNVEKLIESIKLLLENEKLRNEYVEKGKKRVNDFSVEKIIKNYIEVLDIE